jgi:hypothetical protein
MNELLKLNLLEDIHQLQNLLTHADKIKQFILFYDTLSTTTTTTSNNEKGDNINDIYNIINFKTTTTTNPSSNKNLLSQFDKTSYVILQQSIATFSTNYINPTTYA